MEKIKTFLPVFSGFYETTYAFDYESVLYDINKDRQEKGLSDINSNNLEIDDAEYEKDVSISFCKVLEKELSDYVKNITFENLYSPKEYNFTTDSIYCEIEPDGQAISVFIYENKDAFCEYLRANYTSHSGFIPSYSYYFSVWESDMANFTEFSINGHYLGSILQFICDTLEIDNDNAYGKVMENAEDSYVLNWDDCINKPTCQDCGKFIDDQDILKDIKKYKELMKKYPPDTFCVDCLENR